MVENLIPPTSPSETGENTEGSQTQNLETATVEPQAFVEQTGNFQQSEDIQSTLTTVITNVVATQETATTEQSSPGGRGDTVAVLPDPLPSIHSDLSTTQEASPGSGGDTVAVLPNPLPRTHSDLSTTQEASTDGGGDTVEVLPTPLPHVAEQETSPGGGGDTAAVVTTPPPNEGISGGEQQVGSSIGDIRTISGLTPIQMPMPGPDDGGGDTGSVPPNPLPHIDPGMTTGMMTSVVEEPLNGSAIAERHATASRSLDQAQVNDAISAYTGSVEVLAVGPVGEVRAGRSSHFENRDQVQPSQDPESAGIRDGTAPRVETMEGANRELRIEGTATGEPEENPKASGVYAEFSPSGQAWAVDANGKSLDPGPIIKVTMGADGKEHVLAHFPGTPDGDWVELDPYTRSLSDCNASIDRNGTVMFFDANGKALAVQPMYSEQTDSNGNLHIVAWYPGHEDEKTDMPILTHSLDGCSVQIWPDGGMSVVDSKGDWIPFQPNLTTVMGPDGKEHVYAWYPGSSDGGKVELPIYSTSLAGCTAEMKQGGKIVILDAKGQDLPVQPLITVSTGADGKEQVFAWYPSSGEEGKVEIPFYTTSLAGCQVEKEGEDITVVDAKGQPLLVQPIISIVLGAGGKEQVFAWWPNDPEDKVLLPPYTYSPGMTDP